MTSPTEPPFNAENAENAEDMPAVPVIIDGTLDLHTFAPAQCIDVVRAYIEQAQAAGILHLRIIHGKGIGTLRQSVHAELSRNKSVAAFGLADASGGGWGATLVTLRSK